MDVELIRNVTVEALLKANQQGITSALIADETPLGDSGLGMNSLTLMRALVMIEDRLGVTLEDGAVADANFATVGEIVALIRRALGGFATTEPRGLSCLSRKPDATHPHPPALVLLHGHARNERHMFELATGLDPRLRVISVRAPHRVGPGAYRWFATDLAAAEPKIDADEEMTSRTALVALLEDLSVEHSAGGLYLLGFSEGGVMALSLALTLPWHISGCAVASARILPEIAFALNQKGFAHISFFVAHGTDDTVLPIRHGRATYASLDRVSHDLTYREYATGHALTSAMVAEMSTWLSARLDRMIDVSENSRTKDTPKKKGHSQE